MKKMVVKVLLAALNGRWLNNSPCLYGFIGNVDAFSIENLRSEVKQRPEITVRQLIEEAERFASCPKGLTVLEPDGTVATLRMCSARFPRLGHERTARNAGRC